MEFPDGKVNGESEWTAMFLEVLDCKFAERDSFCWSEFCVYPGARSGVSSRAEGH